MAELAHKIRDYFAGKPEIASVYLFGSQASGKERPKSDVDIGILLCSDYIGSAQKLREKYLVDLGRILRKDIHPVIMNQSGELLLKQIFSKGRQDIILFNLQLSIQNCVDIAAHIISEQGFGVPGGTNEMFYTLEEHGYINRDLAEKMVKAVGLRNLIVHEYGKLDLARIHQILQHDIEDLNEFLKTVIQKLGF